MNMMTDDFAEIEERAAFAAYSVFIAHGVGTCIQYRTRSGMHQETPEEACLRRWKNLQPAAKARWLLEARAAIESIRDLL